MPVDMSKKQQLGSVASNADPDQILHSAASDLGLHCLLGPFVQILRVDMIIQILDFIKIISALLADVYIM